MPNIYIDNARCQTRRPLRAAVALVLWVFTIALLVPTPLIASSWNPTLLVNTEAFQIVHEGDSAAGTDVELRFGDTLNEKIYWDRTNAEFRFTDDIRAEGNITGSGTLIIGGATTLKSTLRVNNVTYTFPTSDGSATGKVLKTSGAGVLSWSTDNNSGGSGLSYADAKSYFVDDTGDSMTGALLIQTKANGAAATADAGLQLEVVGTASGDHLHAQALLTASGTVRVSSGMTLNEDVDSNDVGLVFGSDTTSENLSWQNTTDRFEFSDDLHATGNITASGNIVVNTASRIKAGLQVSGILSGATLNIMSGANAYIRSNLGVGTTTPDVKLEIVGTMSGRSLQVTGTGAKPLLFTDPTRGGVAIGSGSAVTSFSVTKSGSFATYIDGVGTTATVGSSLFHQTVTDSSFLNPFRGVVIKTQADLSTNPASATQVGAFYAETTVPSSNVTSLTNLTIRGSNNNAVYNGTSTLYRGQGAIGSATNQTTGTMTNAEAFAAELSNSNASGTIGSGFGLRVGSTFTNAGTITNTYGVWVGDITKGTQTNTPFSFYADDANTYNFFNGSTGIGTKAPETKLEVVGTASGDHLHAQASLTSSGAVRFSTGVILNEDIDAQDVNFVFGSDTNNESLSWVNLADRFEFSDDLRTTGDLYGSGALIVQNASRFKNNLNVAGVLSGATLNIMSGAVSYIKGSVSIGNSAPETKLEVQGTISGAALSIPGTARFNSVPYTFPYSDGASSGKVLKTDSAGKLSWSDDGNSPPISYADAKSYFVDDTGDTMTGALKVRANLSGSTLNVDGNAGIYGNLALSGSLRLNKVTYTFPTSDGTGSGKVLKTNSAGTLSWSTAASGSTKNVWRAFGVNCGAGTVYMGFDSVSCNATEATADTTLRLATNITVTGLQCMQFTDSACTMTFRVRKNAANATGTPNCSSVNGVSCASNTGTVIFTTGDSIDVEAIDTVSGGGNVCTDSVTAYCNVIYTW